MERQSAFDVRVESIADHIYEMTSDQPDMTNLKSSLASYFSRGFSTQDLKDILSFFFKNSKDVFEPTLILSSKKLHDNMKLRDQLADKKPKASGLGPLMKMKCGFRVHKTDYEMHLAVCLESKGGCF